MKARTNGNAGGNTKVSAGEAQPVLGSEGREIQAYGRLVRYPIGLSDEVRARSVEALNALVADTAVLRDLYKKHHWQVSGPTFHQLHLLFDKHYAEQVELLDMMAERVQMLGGVAIAMAHDIAEMTRLARPPRGRERVPVQLSRLLEAHELVLGRTRDAARQADADGDDGTNDLLVSDVIRTHEMQVWFLSEHLVDTPLVHSRDRAEQAPD
jgi:starvation-inducible DNA-binding protein